MLQLFGAERRKMSGFRALIWFTIWIFPIASLGLIAILALALRGMGQDIREASGLLDLRWDDQALTAWSIPGSGLGLFLMVGFMGVAFAGEYQWGTWKNLVIRAPRYRLLLAKYFVILRYMILAMILTSIVVAVGTGVVTGTIGSNYKPAPTPEVLANFAGKYALSALLAAARTTIMASIVAIAAIVSRSLLGCLLAGIVIGFIESVAYYILAIMANWFNAPWVLDVTRILPAYNVSNLSSWLLSNQPIRLPGLYVAGRFISPAPNEVTTSLVLVLVWLIGLVGLSVWLFRRQDITT